MQGEKTVKIAVIDDERPARKMLIRRIKEVLPDCEIVEAENGAGALAMFNEMEKLDLIFVDMDLGDMEGITLAGTAKRLFLTAKIIFATAYSQYAAKAYEMEIDDYILKPFDPARIRHVLEKCTGMRAGTGLKENTGNRLNEESELSTMKTEKQEERKSVGMAENAENPSVFGKIPVTASRGILFLDIEQRRMDMAAWSIRQPDPVRSTSYWENLRRNWSRMDFSGSIKAIWSILPLSRSSPPEREMASLCG